ncbi:MAG: TetR/AcrR family transcriptional regulator [Clostridia bacterium]
MAKQKVSISELYDVTAKILLEKGYAGFHFKLVSDQLNVSRSTIYEYFSNKDELITSLMVHLMEKILAEYEGLDAVPEPMGKLRVMFDSFMKYTEIHQILHIAPLVNAEASENVKQYLATLREQHLTLTRMLTDIIAACKESGSIRKDVPSSLVAGLLFQAIQLPNREKLPEAAWNSLIFDVLLDGFRGIGGHNIATT